MVTPAGSFLLRCAATGSICPEEDADLRAEQDRVGKASMPHNIPPKPGSVIFTKVLFNDVLEYVLSRCCTVLC